jgi:Spy/CpxP family protein refolding chaperone
MAEPNCQFFERKQKGGIEMKPEAVKIVEAELKQFAADLNLTDQQKTQLRSVLENARERMDEIRAKNPDVTRADVIAKLAEVRSSFARACGELLHTGTTG